jgi:hypothetical protein
MAYSLILMHRSVVDVRRIVLLTLSVMLLAPSTLRTLRSIVRSPTGRLHILVRLSLQDLLPQDFDSLIEGSQLHRNGLRLDVHYHTPISTPLTSVYG